jgi:regulator of sigma E protease
MMSFLIFLLFLGPLIFFHELGHFAFARLFGVRVEIFSLGFGPKIFKFKKNDTEYAISAIPLGGYVKMFGDDPYREATLTEEEKKVAFNYKSKWARFWIVFGGPLANFILAFVVYFCLVSVGEKVPETRLGYIPQNTLFYDLGFRSGDRVKIINDRKIISFDDLDFVSDSVSSVVLYRAKQDVNIKLDMKTADFMEHFIKYATKELRAPVVIDQAGNYFLIKSKDVAYNPESSFEEITDGSFPLELFLIKGSNVENFTETNFSAPTQIVNSKEDFYKAYKPLDLVVDSLVMGSPADKAGFKAKDTIISIDGLALTGFEELREYLQKITKDKVEVKIWRDGQVQDYSLVPATTEAKTGNIKTIGVYSAIKLIPTKMIQTESAGVIDSIVESFQRTLIGMEKTVVGYKKLITKEVALKNIGGPLAIAKVAADHFNISLSMFFRLMAMMSINLGIINLLPVPVLDGGHIVFIFLETLSGGPLSKRKMEIAQKFGLSFLFFLIFVALFNDITRYAF